MDLCDTEKRFYENCFTDNFRVDGRTNDQLRPIRIKYGSIPAAWGSATIVYGDDDNEITVSIKAKTQGNDQSASTSVLNAHNINLIKRKYGIISGVQFNFNNIQRNSEKKGTIKFYVESIQTGSSLFTKERKAEKVKNLINSYLDKYMADIIDRDELYLDQNTSWMLNVDVFLPGELSLNQLQHISIAINAAFKDLKFPQVVVTQDQVTSNIEVDLLENMVNEAGTDKLIKVNTKLSPLLILAGISNNNIVFDCNNEECLSVQSSILLAVNKTGKILGVELLNLSSARLDADVNVSTSSVKLGSMKEAIELVSQKAPSIFEFYSLG